MADINQVLSNVKADQATKANAWELFQSSEDQATFTQHLNSLNLPNDAKGQIWEMKFGAGAQSGARSPEAIADYAKRYGLPLDVAERHLRAAAPAPDPNAPGPGIFESLAAGVGKGGLETAQTLVRAANKGAKFLDPLDSPQHPTPQIPIPGETSDTTPEGTAEHIGAGLENILEFIAGDEALKGLSLAEKFGAAQKIAKLAETSPKTAKALDIGMTALRQGAVGGTQTLAHGGTPAQAAESAGVVGGVSAGFGALGAGAGAIYRAITAKSPAEIALAKELPEKEGSALAQKIASGKLGTPYEVAQNVGDQLAKASDQMHADYAQGLAQIGQKAQGIRVPLAGSPLQKTAQTLLSDSSVPAEIQTALKGVVPDAERLNPLLEQFAKGSLLPYSWEQMEATRQMIGDTIRKLPADSPVRTDLIHLRGALDDTMTNAAKQSGNPEVAQLMQNLRSAYATKVQAFDANAIKSLADKNPDSVAGALLNKQSVFSVNTLRSLIGSGNMRPVEGSLLQRLVDNASTGPDGFNPKSFVGSFNRLGPDVQKAIWGDNLPAVQAFLAKAANVPAGSPVWGGLARYVEHRAIFDVLAGGVIFGAGALHDQFSGKRLLGPAAILAGVIALHNPRVMAEASRFMQLGAAAAAPIASSAMTPEPEQTTEPEPTPQAPISSNATIGEQLIAKAQQTQQQRVNLAAQQARPALPFHPGAGVPR